MLGQRADLVTQNRSPEIFKIRERNAVALGMARRRAHAGFGDPLLGLRADNAPAIVLWASRPRPGDWENGPGDCSSFCSNSPGKSLRLGRLVRWPVLQLMPVIWAFPAYP
jgi:hypothetical protein